MISPKEEKKNAKVKAAESPVYARVLQTCVAGADLDLPEVFWKLHWQAEVKTMETLSDGNCGFDAIAKALLYATPEQRNSIVSRLVTLGFSEDDVKRLDIPALRFIVARMFTRDPDRVEALQAIVHAAEDYDQKSRFRYASMLKKTPIGEVVSDEILNDLETSMRSMVAVYQLDEVAIWLLEEALGVRIVVISQFARHFPSLQVPELHAPDWLPSGYILLYLCQSQPTLAVDASSIGGLGAGAHFELFRICALSHDVYGTDCEHMHTFLRLDEIPAAFVLICQRRHDMFRGKDATPLPDYVTLANAPGLPPLEDYLKALNEGKDPPLIKDTPAGVAALLASSKPCPDAPLAGAGGPVETDLVSEISVGAKRSRD